MRIIPLPRRHRLLWLVVVVLAFSAWGSWLAATGRATDYGASTWLRGSSAPTATPPFAGADATQVSAGSAGSPEMTTSAPPPAPGMTASPSIPGTRMTTYSSELRPEPAAPAALSGFTDPIAFAGVVAVLVLSYDPATDLTARTDRVMAVAALPPIGSPAELAADLHRLTQDPVLSYGDATVTFAPDSIQPSQWATARLDELKLPAGSFAIDVTGSQLIALPGQRPVSVSVTVGITGACPPALNQCEIDRIFPRTVAQQLGS